MGLQKVTQLDRNKASVESSVCVKGFALSGQFHGIQFTIVAADKHSAKHIGEQFLSRFEINEDAIEEVAIFSAKSITKTD